MAKTSPECELFREILQRLLDEREMTKVDLAAAAGIHRQTVYKILNGEMSPAYDIACRIADALGVDLEVFRKQPAQRLSV